MNTYTSASALLLTSLAFIECHYEHGRELAVSQYQIITRRFIASADWVKPSRSPSTSCTSPQGKSLTQPLAITRRLDAPDCLANTLLLCLLPPCRVKKEQERQHATNCTVASAVRLSDMHQPPSTSLSQAPKSH